MQTTIDILIKGGGMVGLLAGLALSKAGFSVMIEEKNSFLLSESKSNSALESELKLELESKKENKLTHYDLRVSSLTPVSVNIFRSLGLWENIQKIRVSPFEGIKVWENHPKDALCFDGKTIGEKPLGYIIENRIIRQVLWKACQQSCQFVHEDKDNIPIPVLTLAADGAASETRKHAEIDCWHKPYGQHALITHVMTSLSHQKIARQRFLSTGPLGFLPLLDPHHCSIVWSHQDDTAKALSLMSEVEFNTALQDAFGSELGELRVIAPRLIFPLHMQHVTQYVKHRLALIGDAAHTLHPLAGYGLNMGFLDAMTLTSILKKSRAENRDIGLLHTLRKYERARKSENLFMLKVIDSFTHRGVRSIGIKITAKSQYLKNLFMHWMSHHGEENIFI